MQRLEVSGAVRLIYKSLGVKGIKVNKLEKEVRDLISDVLMTPTVKSTVF